MSPRKNQADEEYIGGWRQGVHNPVVKARRVIRRSGEVKIRDVCQLIVPPRRTNRGVRSEVLIKRIVQVLQNRSDDPRSTGGVGGDLELSSFEALSDGRNRRPSSLSGLDVVWRKGGETEGICGSGSCEVRGVPRRASVGKRVVEV